MAGRIPQSFINDLISRLDIVEVVGSRVTLKKTGKNLSGLCPFHDEKTPSFSVSPDKQFFHCFGCQESGTALSFIMKYDRLEFVEAVEQVARDLGLEVPREGGGRRHTPRVDPDLYEVLGQAERIYRMALRDHSQAIEYLKSRGLTGEVARDFGVGYAPEGWQNLIGRLNFSEQQLVDAGLAIRSEKGRVYDRFRHRIMFPIRDTRGRVIGFGGRVLSAEDSPKYLNSPETEVFRKGTELYGLYEARKALRQLTSLIVVEGYMDVVALSQHGVANSVATLGTATGTDHFRKLFRYADEVICCFDGDNAGRQAAWRALLGALPVLNEHRQLKLAFLPDGEDPDTFVRKMGRGGFVDYLANAQPGLEYLLQRLSEGLDLNSIDGQARFIGLASPHLEEIPPGVLRDLLKARIDTMAGRSDMRREVAAPVQAPRLTAGRKSLSLVRRLLILLMKNPAVATDVEADAVRRLGEFDGPVAVLGQVLEHARAHAVTDVEELLAYWMGTDLYDTLLGAAQVHVELDLPDQRTEFVEGLPRLVAQLEAQARQQNRQNWSDQASIDSLQDYVPARKDRE